MTPEQLDVLRVLLGIVVIGTFVLHLINRHVDDLIASGPDESYGPKGESRKSYRARMELNHVLGSHDQTPVWGCPRCYP